MEGERRYDEAEFDLILRKAAELQNVEELPRSRAPGLTLREITEIAAEVGIEAGAVRRAADALTPSVPEPRPLLSAGTHRHRYHQTVDGHLPAESVPRVIDAVRLVMGQHGDVREELGRVVWSSVGNPTQIHVTLSRAGDRTEVMVTADRSAPSAMTWGLSVAGGMLGGAITGAITEPTTVLAGIGVFVGMTGIGLLSGRGVWALGSRHFARKFAELTATVDAELRSSVVPGEGDGTP